MQEHNENMKPLGIYIEEYEICIEKNLPPTKKCTSMASAWPENRHDMSDHVKSTVEHVNTTRWRCSH